MSTFNHLSDFSDDENAYKGLLKKALGEGAMEALGLTVAEGGMFEEAEAAGAGEPLALVCAETPV